MVSKKFVTTGIDAGKIAASSGHASWISSKLSRSRVFELRGRSDAVIVGGNTVRMDGKDFQEQLCMEIFCYIIMCCFNFTLKTDPRLTARHGGGHLPMRIVMSQTLNLPDVAHLWDVADVPTIVATQRGARRSFQKSLHPKVLK